LLRPLRAVPTGLHSGTLSGLNNDDLDAFGHPDYWIEDTCPDPQVVTINGGAISVGDVCGCGVLILKNTTLNFASKGHLLWRGLVVWQLETASGEVWKVDGGGFSSFVVEGGMLITGTNDFTIKVTKADGNVSTVVNNQNKSYKQSFRVNGPAMADALNGNQSALKAVRRLQ
jgi:hypothetical protein